ncbi:Growth arrest and DNA damage-inducible proteins-interacting protein 1 [Sarcoptes scabiei]|uniref:Large ribosomal subunit protein mL64 n=1 Tax=Sarcoptes scabiei TaxID=52283 RepID=A0A834RDE1_SARSC|nr:Growth arrest and DNA damage-inducible proteins-interacting protein 1 [Sarcoptes scabiei]
MVYKKFPLRSILEQPRLPSTHLPQYVVDRIVGKMSNDSKYFQYLLNYRKRFIRMTYAEFGRQSNLKPGICWPTNDELDFAIQYENKFEKSLAAMKENLLAKQRDEEEKRAKRKKEVMSNLKKLPKMKEEFWKNYHQLFENIREENIKKENLIQEIREYLGYSIEPNDPRFEEAVTKKEEEAKAALRSAKKLERQKQQIEMLQAMVAQALAKEQSESKALTNRK